MVGGCPHVPHIYSVYIFTSNNWPATFCLSLSIISITRWRSDRFDPPTRVSISWRYFRRYVSTIGWPSHPMRTSRYNGPTCEVAVKGHPCEWSGTDSRIRLPLTIFSFLATTSLRWKKIEHPQALDQNYLEWWRLDSYARALRRLIWLNKNWIVV